MHCFTGSPQFAKKLLDLNSYFSASGIITFKKSNELQNIIKFCSRNKNIKLIGITSNKNSILYKNSDIKILMPIVKEAGPSNIVPTSSTTMTMCLTDSMAIACMRHKKFDKFDFKKFHPSGSLATKLKTNADLMLKKNKIPFVYQETTMKNALKILIKKKIRCNNC